MGQHEGRGDPPGPRLRVHFAILIFAGPTIEAHDTRHDYGEQRIRALGEVDGLVLVVIYTDRDDVSRIISASLAGKKERELWQSRE